MDSFRFQQALELPISQVLYLTHFPCLQLTLVVGSNPKSPNRVSFIIIHQTLLKVIRCYTLQSEIVSQGLSYQSDPELQSVCLWNVSQGLVEILNFPNVTKPVFQLCNVQEMLAVCHYAEKSTLYIAAARNAISCYSVTKGTLKNKITLRSEQAIEQIEIHKPKAWLIVRTLITIFLIDTKTETVLNSIKVYKLPTLGVLSCFVNSVVGCTSESKKLVLQIQEASSGNPKGQPTEDHSIEVYSLAGLRKDFRISLEAKPAFAAVSEKLNGIIWSEDTKIKGFDMKTKEVAELLSDAERIVAGVLISQGEHCPKNKRENNILNSNLNSKPLNFVIATRSKVKIFS